MDGLLFPTPSWGSADLPANQPKVHLDLCALSRTVCLFLAMLFLSLPQKRHISGASLFFFLWIKLWRHLTLQLVFARPNSHVRLACPIAENVFILSWDLGLRFNCQSDLVFGHIKWVLPRAAAGLRKILTLLHLHVRLGELQQEVFVCEILGIVVASISSTLPL